MSSVDTMCGLRIFVILALKLSLISCQSECNNIESCGDCIGYPYSQCVWCLEEDPGVGKRCKSKVDYDKNPAWCKTIYNPEPDLQILENYDFDDVKKIQFKPQFMKIKARPGVPVQFVMSYKPAKDYPLDIYYLIDYSLTMKTWTENLQEQGRAIYKKLTNITNNVRFGVGSFVDKPGLPIADISMQVSYSFKNHLSLTNNMTLFENALLQKPEGTNNDDPEAVLDGLMQAMVCKKEIDWREGAHRVIIVSTDASYHNAGDGKFVGAVKPHDMKCHVENNEYKMALMLDYPSISQINKVAKENNFRIFFSVVSKVQGDYMGLEKKISNAKCVELSTNSNLVDMIESEYKKMVTSVKIEANFPPIMSVTYTPDCTIKDQCEYKYNTPTKINGTLTILSCPNNDKYNYNVKVGPKSLDEKLTLDIEIGCKCDCEKPGTTSVREENSERCNKYGTYQCGVCECHEGRYGNDCTCTGLSTTREDFEKCKANREDSNYCSGRGSCRCGKCFDCHEGFSGAFCEFDDTACPRTNRLLCSGHGKCTQGKCFCDPHWINLDCSCPDNDRGCIAPYSTELCSGKGTCKCGTCECNRANASEEYCSGTYCDQCEELIAKRCKELEDYAYCNLKKNKSICDEENENKFNDTDIQLVSKEEIYSPTWHTVKLVCKSEIEEEGTLIFKYHYPTTKTATLLLIIQNELDKPAEPEILVAVGSAIGAVLIIGIVTVIAWKVLVDLHDKREYNKFLKEAEAAGDISINPLYKLPTLNFANPTYCE